MKKTLYFKIILKNGVVVEDKLTVDRRHYQEAVKAATQVQSNFSRGDCVELGFTAYRPEDISALCVTERRRDMFRVAN